MLPKNFFLYFLSLFIIRLNLIVAVPYEAYPLDKQFPPVARVNEQFTFQISNDTYESSFGNSVQITYTALNLPSWLTFDSASRTFSGVPTSEFIPGSSTTQYFQIGLSGLDQQDNQYLTNQYTLVVSSTSTVKLASDFDLLTLLKKFGTANGNDGLIVSPFQQFNITFDKSQFISSTSANLEFYGRSEQYNAPLPSWCSFDPNTLMFSGVAPAVNSEIAPEFAYELALLVTDVPGYAGLTVPFEVVVGAHQLTTTAEHTHSINITDDNTFDYNLPLENIYLDGTPISTNDIGNLNLLNAPNWVTLDNYAIKGTFPTNQNPVNFSLAFYDKYADALYLNFELSKKEEIKLFTISSLPNINATKGEWFSYNFQDSQFTDFKTTNVSIDFSNVTNSHDWLSFDSNNLTLHGKVPQNFDEFELGLLASKNNEKQVLQFKLSGINPPKSSSIYHSSSTHKHSSSVYSSSYKPSGRYSSSMSSSVYISSSYYYSMHSSSSHLNHTTTTHRHNISSTTHHNISTTHKLNSSSITSHHNKTAMITPRPTSSSIVSSISYSTSQYNATSVNATLSTHPVQDSVTGKHHSRTTAIAAGVTVPIGTILIISILFLFWRNNRKHRNKPKTDSESNAGLSEKPQEKKYSQPPSYVAPIPVVTSSSSKRSSSYFSSSSGTIANGSLDDTKTITEDDPRYATNIAGLKALSAFGVHSGSSFDLSSTDYDDKLYSSDDSKHDPSSNRGSIAMLGADAFTSRDNLLKPQIMTSDHQIDYSSSFSDFYPNNGKGIDTVIEESEKNTLDPKKTYVMPSLNISTLYMDEQPVTKKSWRNNTEYNKPSTTSQPSPNTVSTTEVTNTEPQEFKSLNRNPFKTSLVHEDSVLNLISSPDSPVEPHSIINTRDFTPKRFEILEYLPDMSVLDQVTEESQNSDAEGDIDTDSDITVRID